MYYNDIVCKDCGRILAKMNQTITVDTEPNTLCYACASVRYSKVKEQQPTPGKAS